MDFGLLPLFQGVELEGLPTLTHTHIFGVIPVIGSEASPHECESCVELPTGHHLGSFSWFGENFAGLLSSLPTSRTS